MEPIASAASASSLLKNLLAIAVPPGGSRRFVLRQQRRDVYLRFERAAYDAAAWAAYLPVVELSRNRELLTASLPPGRTALVDFLDSLGQLRTLGNPVPRQRGEEIAVLVAELFEVMPVPRPSKGAVHIASYVRERPEIDLLARKSGLLSGFLDVTAKRREEFERRLKSFHDTQQALGFAHREFILAVRNDLGQGRRFWHKGKRERNHAWQFWRPPELWPGGFPPPSAQDFIAYYKSKKET